MGQKSVDEVEGWVALDSGGGGGGGRGEGGTESKLDYKRLQWNLLIRTPLGPAIVERLSSFRDD